MRHERADLVQFVEWLQTAYPTLYEKSISGDGWHFYYQGGTPQGWKSRRAGVTIYDGSHARFIAVTGWEMSSWGTINDGTAFLADPRIGRSTSKARLSCALWQSMRSSSAAPRRQSTPHQSSSRRVTTFAACSLRQIRVNGQGRSAASLSLSLERECRSRTHTALSMRVPFVTQTEPKGKEERYEKLRRLFWKGHEWETAVALAANAGFFNVLPPPPPVDLEPESKYFSPMAIRAIQRIANGVIDEKHLHLTHPPGLFGELVRYVESGDV